MSDVFFITNRNLCKEDFLIRIEKIAMEHPRGIILREKDLPKLEYMSLAKQVIEICEKYDTSCILHSFPEVAKEMDWKALHLPMHILRTMSEEERNTFSVLGASSHSVEEAKEAESLGCTYIIAGHIFETDCKKGLKGRGLDFLHDVCKNVSIPVYAIGGITSQNVAEVRKAGAAGACVMSGGMTCESPEEYLSEWKKM